MKAARKLLTLTRANPEHPMFGKELIAAAIALLGDRPLNWRMPSLLFGALGLFAFGRVLWLPSGRRFATIAGMLLLATSFAWFIQSRIAMLDMIMAGLAMVALWHVRRGDASASPPRPLAARALRASAWVCRWAPSGASHRSPCCRALSSCCAGEGPSAARCPDAQRHAAGARHLADRGGAVARRAAAGGLLADLPPRRLLRRGADRPERSDRLARLYAQAAGQRGQARTPTAASGTNG